MSTSGRSKLTAGGNVLAQMAHMVAAGSSARSSAGVFISYRRSDSDVAAGRLADDLMEIFGHDAIFRDVDTLQLGEDYTTALDRALDNCGALIAVIGPRWVSITDAAGRRRLDDPLDWVRSEITRALARGIRVIPVLISATMPPENDVPQELRPLVHRQALEISDVHWRQDIELLAQALESVPGVTRQQSPAETAKSKLSFLGKRWIQMVFGFSASTAVGLSPLLGNVVSWFAPLQSILPEAVQPVAIPLSAAAMGIAAAGVQWHFADNDQADQLRAWFRRALAACAISLALLAGIETMAVVRVEVPAIDQTVSFAVGPYHPDKPPCTGLSRSDCIKHHLSLDEATINSYFGEGWVNITKFTLVVVYTLFTSAFGAVGVILARQLRIRFTHNLS